MKRIVSLMLSVIIIFGLVCVAAPSVSAASAMKTSTNGINLIKAFEGPMEEWPYEDHGQWSVGYGTGVSGEDLEYYNKYGITEAQATTLLKKYVETFEAKVNQFIDNNNLKLSQHQFDALICFTYNNGYAWTTNTNGLRSAVVSGATGNDFIYAIAQFCKASGQVVGGLVKRRLAEANLYLNGVYSTSAPANYKYVQFDSNLEDVVPTVSVQGYDTAGSSAIKASASKSGYTLLGWYTKAEGGKAVTKLNQSTASTMTLYAHWQQGDGERNEDGSIKGVSAEYSGYAPYGANQKTYKAPGGAEAGKLKADTKLKVVAEYVDGEGIKWGQLKDGKWIQVGSGLAASPVYEKASSIIDPIEVTVTTNNVNNRVGPGTNYASQGKFAKGTKLTLTAVQKGGSYKWGKSEQGWIALQYTDYETAVVMGSEDAKKVTAIATITNTDILNVRSGAGIHNAKVGTYNRGDQVKITLQQKVGGTTWGLTEKGWISLYYAKVTKVKDGEVPDIDISGSTGTGTGTGTGTNTGAGSNTDTVVKSGRVYNCSTLRIRSAAGTQNAHVGNYAAGTYVDIYETVKLKNDTWGRTDKGWISLRYVQLDATISGAGVTGRVYNCTQLNVRAGAGTQFAKVGKLNKGTKVEILEYTKVGKATWGRTVHGWISLYYVLLDTPVTNLDNNVLAPDGAGTGTGTGTGTGGMGSAPEATEPEATEPEATEPEATEPVTKYTVKINTAEGGKVTANTTSCAAETEVILTVAPESGYELDALSVVNTKTNAAVTVSGGKFTMPEADVNVVATFKKATVATYAVSIKTCVNGSVSASTTTAKENDVVTLTINPAADFALDALTVKDSANNVITCKAVTGKDNTVTFKMPKADVTVAATFKAATYTVDITNSTADKGTVSVNPTEYEKGATVTLIVTPAYAQYEVKSLTVKAGDKEIETKKDGANYTFTMPAEDVTVVSSFAKIRYALNIAQTTGGTVTADKETYAMNETVTVTIKPDTGYSRGTMIIKNGDKEIEPTRSGLVFTFKMPGAAVDVKHEFKKNAYELNIKTNSYGKIIADKETYGYKDLVTLTIQPVEGYVLNAIAAKNGSAKMELKEENGKYIFEMPIPDDEIVISATYKEAPVQYKVTYEGGKTINIRETASKSGADLGDIPNGTILEALEGSTDTWVKVTYKGITGWVFMDNLTKVTK